MKNLNIMIKPASSLCNMRCAYCFYHDVSQNRERQSFGIMSGENAKKLIDSVFTSLNNGDRVTFAFQGGEPLLAGLPFYELFTEYASRQNKKVAVNYALQTNGMNVDDAWCAFFKKHKFLLGLSMDGPQKQHDVNRLDGSGKGTYNEVRKAKELFEQYRVEYNILTVLTNSLARHPQDMWTFIVKNRIKYIQFIPCLSDLFAGEKSAYALSPDRFASFYIHFFKLWKDSLERGSYLSVRLFDDIITLLSRGEASACGMAGRCQPQFVVEADGSAYPCDFYCMDEYRLGNMCESSPRELFESNEMKSFLADGGAPFPLCGECGYKRMCGGNCKRQRSAMCGSAGANVCGYRSFLDSCLNDLNAIAKRLR